MYKVFIFYLFLISCVNTTRKSLRELIVHRCDPEAKNHNSVALQSGNAQISKNSSALSVTPHNLPWENGKAIYVSTYSMESIEVIPNIDKEKFSVHEPLFEKYAWDFVLSYGQEVRSSHSGTIRKLKNGLGSGGCSESFANSSNYVVVYWDDGSGRESLYLHFKTIAPGIAIGKKIKRGEIIGYAGNSGWVCPTPTAGDPTAGTHLHYQVQSGAKNENDQSTSYYLNSIKTPFTEINTPEKLRSRHFTSEMTLESIDSPPPSPPPNSKPPEKKPSSTSDPVTPVPNENETNNSSDACPR